ncbi:hypothetical protein PACTADRAFT_47636, partial [Pachysolen tannophilus NRRL Y-2460]
MSGNNSKDAGVYEVNKVNIFDEVNSLERASNSEESALQIREKIDPHTGVKRGLKTRL